MNHQMDTMDQMPVSKFTTGSAVLTYEHLSILERESKMKI